MFQYERDWRKKARRQRILWAILAWASLIFIGVVAAVATYLLIAEAIIVGRLL